MDSSRSCGRVMIAVIAFCAVITLPELAFAQASPFLTGANSLQTNILAWLTPVAIILIMVLAAWRWPIECPGDGALGQSSALPLPSGAADRDLGARHVRGMSDE